MPPTGMAEDLEHRVGEEMSFTGGPCTITPPTRGEVGLRHLIHMLGQSMSNMNPALTTKIDSQEHKVVGIFCDYEKVV